MYLYFLSIFLISSFGLITLLLFINCTPECDSPNDISVRPPTRAGVQNTLPEMASDYWKFSTCIHLELCTHWAFLSTGTAAILFFYLMQR